MEDDAPATTGEIFVSKGLKFASHIYSWPIQEAGSRFNDHTLQIRSRSDGEIFAQITEDWSGDEDDE